MISPAFTTCAHSAFFASLTHIPLSLVPSHCLKEYTGHVNTKFCLPSSFSTLHVPRQYIISGSEDGRIVFWDVVSKEAVASVSTPHHKEAVLCVAAHPTKTILVSASIDAPHDIVLWRHVPITTTTTTTT